MRTDARRCLAHVRMRRGEHAEAIRLAEEIIELTAGTDAVISRIWTGAMHVDALWAVGRHDEARQRLATLKELVGCCQTPLFEREVTRLEAIVTPSKA